MRHNAALTLPFAVLLITAIGCAAPVKPVGADAARAALTALQAETQLAARVPSALLEADTAVRAAELPTKDLAAGQHAVYVAQRKVDIARAEAERRAADEALTALKQEREKILAEAAALETEIAQAQAAAAAQAALQHQQAAALAQQQMLEAQATTEALRRELQLLEAEATDRGMVMTLGDVLFASGKAELLPGAQERLDRLTAFLYRYADRSVLIEGHTDSQGSDDKNRLLAERRAEAVRAYLISQSIAATRLSSAGRGPDAPVADNATAEGRQQNRRVEIIILQP